MIVLPAVVHQQSSSPVENQYVLEHKHLFQIYFLSKTSREQTVELVTSRHLLNIFVTYLNSPAEENSPGEPSRKENRPRVMPTFHLLCQDWHGLSAVRINKLHFPFFTRSLVVHRMNNFNMYFQGK